MLIKLNTKMVSVECMLLHHHVEASKLTPACPGLVRRSLVLVGAYQVK
jgi:hypothetical protein